MYNNTIMKAAPHTQKVRPRTLTLLMPKSVISVHLGVIILKKSPNHGGDDDKYMTKKSARCTAFHE